MMNNNLLPPVSDYSKDMYGYPDFKLTGDVWRDLGVVCVNGKYETTRMVGTARLETTGGDWVVLRVLPRFKSLQPLMMLEELTQDDEFLNYHVEGSKEKSKGPIYRIFHDEPLVRAPSSGEGEALTALAYIMQLYDLCKRQLKPQMSQVEENLNGKVKGRILFKPHIRRNVLRGQEHKVYCRYNLHTVDNMENRILKEALRKAKEKIKRFYGQHPSQYRHLSSRISYCEHALHNVTQTQIRARDFAQVRTTGYYAYYKPAIALARLIIEKTSASLSEEEGDGLVVPYAIDMQRLFEVYIYAKLKRYINRIYNPGRYKLSIQKYSEAYPIAEKKIGDSLHIQENVIPDYVLVFEDPSVEGSGKRKVAVLDAKYKHSNVINRDDTLQILAYGYLFHADLVGFLFPAEEGRMNLARKINLHGNANEREPRYAEIFLNTIGQADSGSTRDRLLVEPVIHFLMEQLTHPDS